MLFQGAFSDGDNFDKSRISGMTNINGFDNRISDANTTPRLVGKVERRLGMRHDKIKARNLLDK